MDLAFAVTITVTVVVAVAITIAIATAVAIAITIAVAVAAVFEGAIQSPTYALKGPKMLKKDHTPNFLLQHAHKDMKLAVDMAKGVGSRTR